MLKLINLIVSMLFLMVANPALPQSSESYRFERMWPTLQQPWYFNQPEDLAVSPEGDFYVADTLNDRVVKLNPQGKVITSVSSIEGARASLFMPKNIAIDTKGYVYVADERPFSFLQGPSISVHKFDSNLDYVEEFLFVERESGPIVIHGMEIVDELLVLSVTDSSEYPDEQSRFGELRFYSLDDKQLIRKWTYDAYDWDFAYGTGGALAADNQGNIYVSDRNQIFKYEGTGNFITSLEDNGQDPDSGSEFSQFGNRGMALDTEDNLYVCDGYGLQKFTIDGDFLNYIPMANYGYYEVCDGVEIHEFEGDRTIFVTGQHGVYGFSEDSEPRVAWTSKGADGYGFRSLRNIELDSKGELYIFDNGWPPEAIVKTDAEGNILARLNLYGDDALNSDIHIKDDFLYAGAYIRTDGLNKPQISKFDLQGNFESAVFLEANDARVSDFVIDDEGHIFVVLGVIPPDTFFTSEPHLAMYSENGELLVDLFDREYKSVTLAQDGTILASFDSKSGSRFGWVRFDSELNEIEEIDVSHKTDGFGQIVTDNFGNVILFGFENVILFGDTPDRMLVSKFSPNGDFLESFVGIGIGAGQSKSPGGAAVDSQNNLYFVDGGFNRIQKFSLTSVTDNSKAIVVSAGGAFAGNNLWDTTQLSANFAYRALTYQGFTKDSIYYLSSDLDLDLDQNGVADDVDADATNANLEYAITEWATDADNLIIYLVDHGGVDTFRMSGNEVMYSDELADWVNELQQSMPGRVTLVYDACESGTFMSALQPPAGVERTVITSTSPGENAVFISQGSISFSNYFWTHVFNGLSLEDAFSLSSEALTSTTDHQHPMLDYNGDGVSDTDDLALVSNVYIGNGTDLQASAPDVFGVSLPQVIAGTSTATITADGVEDEDGVSRVWVVARPPDYQQGESGNPVQDLPSFDLSLQGDGVYTGSWDGFTTAGTYQLAIYASDRIGNTSVPLLTTVSVNSPLSKRAILVAAGEAGSPDYQIASQSTDVAYEALRQQGYDDEAIYYLSHTGTLGVDGSPSLSNLEFGITSLGGDDTRDLVVYLVGAGHKESITVTGNEHLTPAQLATWLDGLTAEIDGNVTVVIDTDNSGSFVQSLGNDKRIVVTGSGAEQPAHFFNGGDISYSHFYWRKVFNGSTVRDAHLFATRAMRFAAESQEAQLEDNGDGIPNTKQDGELARHELHGSGILLAGDEPLIGSITQSQVINPGQSLPIDVSGIATTGTIATVTAIVTSPAGEITTYTLNGANTDYGLDGVAFTTPGIYDVAIYATDENRNTSLPITTEVEVQEAGFEVSLNSSQASYTAGQILSLSTAIEIGPSSYNGLVDLYWTVTLPDGNSYYITDLNLTIATEPTPVVTDWSPGTIGSTELLAFPLPDGLPTGDYTWRLTLTERGQPYTTSNAWLAQGRVVHVIQ